jgi:hypothetical protein
VRSARACACAGEAVAVFSAEVRWSVPWPREYLYKWTVGTGVYLDELCGAWIARSITMVHTPVQNGKPTPILEGCLKVHKLIQQDPERPHVAQRSHLLVCVEVNHLGRAVLRRCRLLDTFRAVLNLHSRRAALGADTIRAVEPVWRSQCSQKSYPDCIAARHCTIALDCVVVGCAVASLDERHVPVLQSWVS